MRKNTIDLTGKKYFRGKLPPGRIHKRYTGIGATTAEIRNKKRNSIIVMPTKSLAATKAISEDIMYVGSTFPGVTPKSSKDILKKLKKKKKELIKIAVVADSFVKLFDEIGEELEKDEHNFFLMFDEIDSFQSESNYRPKLEECIDIYFKFRKPENRCMISATLQHSNDQEIEGQKLTEFIKNDVNPIALEVVNCQHEIIVSTAKLVKEKYDNLQKKDKILVAYNRIDNIKLVISLLESFGIDKREIKILAGEGSKGKLKGDEQGELQENKLPSKINFITAAYFVGVDIKENTHTLVVADTEIYYTTPTKAKIIQILGRTRGKLRSATLLLQFRPERHQPINEYESLIEGEIIRSLKSYKCITKYTSQYPDSQLLQRQVEGFAEASAIDGVKLLRKVDVGYKKARLAVDFLVYNQEAWNTLYRDKTSLLKKLKNEFQVNYQEDNTEPTPKEQETIQRRQNLSQEEKIDNSLAILRLLKVKYQIGITRPSSETLFDKTLADIILKIKYKNLDIQNAYRRLKVIAVDQDLKALKKLHKKVKLLNLNQSHPFWVGFYNHFEIGKVYCKKEVEWKLQQIELKVQDPSIISQNEINTTRKAITFLGNIVKKINTTKYQFDDPNNTLYKKQVRGYKIKEILTLDSAFN